MTPQFLRFVGAAEAVKDIGPGQARCPKEHTSAELAELFGVARSTVYRAIDRAAKAAPKSGIPTTVPA